LLSPQAASGSMRASGTAIVARCLSIRNPRSE
jgi:hypothetical protein